MVKCWHMIWESIFLFWSKPALGLNCLWEPQSNHHCLSRHKHSKRYTVSLPPLHTRSQSISHTALEEVMVFSGQNRIPGLLDLTCLENHREMLTKWGKTSAILFTVVCDILFLIRTWRKILMNHEALPLLYLPPSPLMPAIWSWQILLLLSWDHGVLLCSVSPLNLASFLSRCYHSSVQRPAVAVRGQPGSRGSATQELSS